MMTKKLMKRLPLIIILAFAFNSCTTKESNLTKREEVFFKEMEKLCHCNVSSGIDWYMKETENTPHSSKGVYIVSFSGIPDSKLKKDSLRIFSAAISKIIYSEILEKNTEDDVLCIQFSGILEQYKNRAADSIRYGKNWDKNKDRIKDSVYYTNQLQFDFSKENLLQNNAYKK